MEQSVQTNEKGGHGFNKFKDSVEFSFPDGFEDSKYKDGL